MDDIKPLKRGQILMLEDRYEFRAELSNLGERAHYAGVRNLIESNSSATITSAQWNVFQCYNSKSYAKVKARGRDPMDYWYQQVLHQVSTTGGCSGKLLSLLKKIQGTQILKPLDKWSKLNTGQDFVSAIEARYFKCFHIDRLVKQLTKSDLVIFNGGGVLADHLEDYLPGRLFALYLAKKMACKLLVVNHSVVLNRPRNRMMAIPVLGIVDYHLVREPLSRNALESLGVLEDKIGITYDAAFAVPDVIPNGEKVINAIGIMIRGDRSVDFDAWASLIKKLQAQYGVEVYYLQGCKKYDAAIRHELGKRCQLADDTHIQDYPQLLRQIAQMRLLVTDRYHGMIFSLLASTPFVPVQSLSHKSLGLLKLHKYKLDLLPVLTEDRLSDFLLAIDCVMTKQMTPPPNYAQEVSQIRQALNQTYQKLLTRFGLGI